MKVFVYGSLKRGFLYHSFLETSEFLGNAHIMGYDLYDLGSYPAILKSKDDKSKVYGEVYEVDQETLRRLDKLEIEEDDYIRVSEKAMLNETLVDVDIYEYNGKLSHSKRIGESWQG